jgi:hypothetical protein
MTARHRTSLLAVALLAGLLVLLLVVPADRRSKHVSEFEDQRFDYVVTVCDRAREACPELPGGPEAIHWSIPDPARGQGTDDQILAAFQRLASELEIRVGFLIDAIDSTPSSEEAYSHA